MPDPIQPNTPTPITPADPVAPVLPSPQEMVDAALSGDVGVSTTAKSMQNPQSESLPNLPSIEPSIVKSPESVIAQPSPSTTPKEPIMSDDTPLAFASVRINPKTQLSPVPPVSDDKPKTKNKLGLVFAGILLLVIAVGGGFWGYQYYAGAKTPQVALTKPKTAEERAEQQAENQGSNYQQQINANQAQYGGYAGGGTGVNSNAFIGSDQEKIGQITAITDSAIEKAEAANLGDKAIADLKNTADAAIASITKNGVDTSTALNNGTPVNKDALNIIDVMEAAAIVKGKAIGETGLGKVPAGMYLADPSKPVTLDNLRVINTPGVVDGLYARALAYPNGTEKLLFMADPKDGGWGMTPAQFDIFSQQKLLGFTFVPGGVGCYSSPNETPTETPSDPTNDSCDLPHWTLCVSAAGIDGVGCDVVKTTGGKTNITSSSHSICNTTTKACEIVAGAGTNTCTTHADCGGTIMSCTGLTYTPSTAPVIGDKLVFTCAGTVTPSTAGTLSYKFRYSTNGGTPVALTNLVATPTKAELTINSCGTYKVECQACATIAGVLKCDPTWIGATQ
ncbi:hypothetical protein KBD75_01460 [Candidatus Woesebacteria bacterium]|nr:hypothetical protein [Candidatus Woesebacteria bacterium]